MDINMLDFLKPELLVLIPTCWGIGLALKATPVANKWIPLLLAFISVTLALLWVISDTKALCSDAWTTAVFAAVTQGVIEWLIAWLTYEKGIKYLQGLATADREDGRD